MYWAGSFSPWVVCVRVRVSVISPPCGSRSSGRWLLLRFRFAQRHKVPEVVVFPFRTLWQAGVERLVQGSKDQPQPQTPGQELGNSYGQARYGVHLRHLNVEGLRAELSRDYIEVEHEVGHARCGVDDGQQGRARE